MPTKRRVLFIPGRGDRDWLYRHTVWTWQLAGYETYVHRFGWNDFSTSLAQKQAALLNTIDGISPNGLNVIGMSAGGPAAIYALHERPTIRRVITVASPLSPKELPANRFLEEQVMQIDQLLREADWMFLRKILSVHGTYDSVVPLKNSWRRGVRSLRLPTIGHGPTIFLAMTALSRPLQRFLAD